MELAKVESKPGLVKDQSSGCVINTDTNAFYAARLAKQRILEEKKKNESLESRITKLESIMASLIEDKV